MTETYEISNAPWNDPYSRYYVHNSETGRFCGSFPTLEGARGAFPKASAPTLMSMTIDRPSWWPKNYGSMTVGLT